MESETNPSGFCLQCCFIEYLLQRDQRMEFLT